MFKRIERSWSLVKASAAIVRDDTSLLVLPLISAVCAGVVLATFAIPMISAAPEQTANDQQPWFYLWLFALYTVLYFVGIFFNTALVSVALVRLGGGEARVRDGLALAGARAGRILGYAVIAATVGIILRALEERVGWIGRLVISLLGVAWTAATFLVVPILATRDLSPIEAVTESSRLLKDTWGENAAGALGMGAAFVLLYLLIIAVGGGAAIAFASIGQTVLAGVMAAALVLSLVVAALFQSALQSIYSAALYRYATGDTSGFAPELLQSAFAPRKK
jgi:hypothetical protein